MVVQVEAGETTEVAGGVYDEVCDSANAVLAEYEWLDIAIAHVEQVPVVTDDRGGANGGTSYLCEMTRPSSNKHAVEAEYYLTRFPELGHWIVRCVVCQHRGRRADMPDEITRRGGTITAAGWNLRHYFPHVLSLDYLGRCENCRRHFDP